MDNFVISLCVGCYWLHVFVSTMLRVFVVCGFWVLCVCAFEVTEVYLIVVIKIEQ